MSQRLLANAIQEVAEPAGLSFAEVFLVAIVGIILVMMALAIPIFLAIALKPRSKMRRGVDGPKRSDPPGSAWEESGRRTEPTPDDEHMGNYG